MMFQVPKLHNFFSVKIIQSKNYKVYFFVILFLLVNHLIFSQKNQFTLTIDAGHGGHDHGASYYGNKEKDVALSIVLKLGKMIEEKQKDVKVVYTRTDDTYPELYRRAEIANNAKSNLFISVHCNSSPKPGGNAVGTETWVLGAQNNKKKNDNFDVVAKENAVIFLEKNYKENYDGYDPTSPESVIGMTLMQDKFLENSLRFAQIMEETFIEKEQRPSRGVKQGPFLVLVKTAMPSVLIET